MSENTFVGTSGEVTTQEIPKKIKDLAVALSKRHGDIYISRESGGIHLNMASPARLEVDGPSELNKRHLAVNAERYFHMGKWSKMRGTYNADLSGKCMKSDTPYRVTELLKMPTLARRGIDVEGDTSVKISVSDKNLVDDGEGNMIPEHPGRVIPFSEIQGYCPGIEFLEGRQYNLAALERQFRCGYCIQEKEESRVAGRFYKRLPDGFKDTPQGRVVFFADMLGVQKGWQARILERIRDEDYHEIWHPYRMEWVVIKIKLGDSWKMLPQYAKPEKYEWNPSKYKTALGASRNAMIMGLDAAIRWNVERGRINNPVCILSEGPLDAGRFMEPGLALLGKFLSENQALIIAKHFREVVFVADNDAVGQKTRRRIKSLLGTKVKLRDVSIPEDWISPITNQPAKDPGDLSYEMARELVGPYLI